MIPVRRRLMIAAVLVAMSTSGSPLVRAYVLKQGRWPDGAIPMQMQLGSSSGSLMDGASDWGVSAEAAMYDWNQRLSGLRFTVFRNSTAQMAQSNGLNNFFWSGTVYGDAFGTETLAVTLSHWRGAVRTEADIVFNNTRQWNSYRGRWRYDVSDFRRVALHELGHVLGLGHPDEEGQLVQAIMNSRANDIEGLTADDISGANALYRSDSTPPPIPPATSTGLPASSHPYADNTDASVSYTLSGNPTAINVTFDPRTAVEQDYDYIYVTDVNGAGVSGSPFTGASLAGRLVRVPGGTVRIRLTSDSSVTDWGFAVTSVTSASVNAPTTSQFPASGHPYANSIDQGFSYTLAGNPSAILVTFDARTDVERDYDYLYVTDGAGNNVAGSPFTGLRLAGATLRVPGSTVRVRLTTDSSVTAWGFAITNVARSATFSPNSAPGDDRGRDGVPSSSGSSPSTLSKTTASSAGAFPSRRETLDFGAKLAASVPGDGPVTFVNTPSAVMWMGEYVKYRFSSCDHDEARARVVAQMTGWGIQPLCAAAVAGLPDAADVARFRQSLEPVYRDTLRQPGERSTVDEGTQSSALLEYVRARIAASPHDAATARAVKVRAY